MSAAVIERLLRRRADLWRACELSPPPGEVVPTGFPALNALLPGGGWPLGALTEILAEYEGIGALRLVMPALAHLSRADRWLVWITPPYIPYAPALANAGVNLARVLLVYGHGDNQLWALEQVLRSGACGGILAWLKEADFRTLRRLQLAAQTGRSWGVLFRPHWVAGRHSAAALRLKLAPAPNGLAVHVLKRRNGWPAEPVFLQWIDGNIS